MSRILSAAPLVIVLSAFSASAATDAERALRQRQCGSLDQISKDKYSTRYSLKNRCDFKIYLNYFCEGDPQRKRWTVEPNSTTEMSCNHVTSNGRIRYDWDY
ncbi:hypothetical protein [Pandoraea bronchicola]|uniref:Uncharacterized protein n=1 Tax=Pandoraea bronchicola TaxID=2508287 RepID=A0A5E5BQX8_9BURK|nr:hypothetical protein [Pandoraea bronchicola]VVE87542.1 hypothetical protein PBR20603_01478 [Pandoraea bronchicola]